jgi:hypothetical protein
MTLTHVELAAEVAAAQHLVVRKAAQVLFGIGVRQP